MPCSSSRPITTSRRQEGLYRHFKAVNDAVGIPIIIYNIPPRSVIDMSVATMARLYELANIAGVKDATANLARVSQQRQAMGADFIQLSGEDMTALAYNAAGGHGCISVVSNVAPRLCAELQGKSLDGDYAGALQVQDRLVPLHDAIFLEARSWRAPNAASRCSDAATRRSACRCCRSARRRRAPSARP